MSKKKWLNSGDVTLNTNIQQELYRKDLNPEILSWEEVSNAAERAEVWLKLDIRSKLPNSGPSSSNNAPAAKVPSGAKRVPSRFLC